MGAVHADRPAAFGIASVCGDEWNSEEAAVQEEYGAAVFWIGRGIRAQGKGDGKEKTDG